MKFILQPANSPDTNVNDLYFFRSLARHVEAHERENPEFARIRHVGM